MLALYFALGGQVRAVDVPDPDDSYELTSAYDDDFITPSTFDLVETPAEGLIVPIPPLTIGAGRTAVSELFRPPQIARA